MHISNNLEILTQLAKEKNFGLKATGKNISLDIPEKHLSEFLNEISARDIKYDEISIDKPTLEDYFLQAAKSDKV